jgi:hypothetical protein
MQVCEMKNTPIGFRIAKTFLPVRSLLERSKDGLVVPAMSNGDGGVLVVVVVVEEEEGQPETCQRHGMGGGGGGVVWHLMQESTA